MILLQLCGMEIIPLVVNVPSILTVPSTAEVVTFVTAIVYYILGAAHLGHKWQNAILMLCMMVVISELQVCFGLELMVKNKERQKRERKKRRKKYNLVICIHHTCTIGSLRDLTNLRKKSS